MELTRILEHIKNLYENYDTVCKKLTTERKYSEDLQSQLTTTKEALKEAVKGIKALETYDLERWGINYSEAEMMVRQDKTVESEYCGDYVNVEELKALLNKLEEDI